MKIFIPLLIGYISGVSLFYLGNSLLYQTWDFREWDTMTKVHSLIFPALGSIMGIILGYFY